MEPGSGSLPVALKLPIVGWEGILQFLKPTEMPILLRVCRKLRKMIFEEAKIELDMHNLHFSPEVSPNIVKFLRNFKKVHTLKLSGPNIDRKFLNNLPTYTHMNRLVLTACPLLDHGSGSITLHSKFPNLSSILFVSEGLHPTILLSVSHLVRMVSLEMFAFGKCLITSPNLLRIAAKCPRITKLCIGATIEDGKSLLAVSKSCRLEELCIERSPRVTDTVLSEILAYNQLSTLGITSCSVSLPGLLTLIPRNWWASLDRFTFTDCKVSGPKAVEDLMERARNLTLIDISPLGDEDFIFKSSSLTSIDLSNQHQANDEKLRSLRIECKKLQTLTIGATRLSKLFLYAPLLTYLNISSNLSGKHMAEVLQCTPNLRTLKTEYMDLHKDFIACIYSATSHPPPLSNLQNLEIKWSRSDPSSYLSPPPSPPLISTPPSGTPLSGTPPSQSTPSGSKLTFLSLQGIYIKDHQLIMFLNYFQNLKHVVVRNCPVRHVCAEEIRKQLGVGNMDF
ncbi:hypothetical protein AAMO2058_001478500 [Amorphochlora amoebiformis]